MTLHKFPEHNDKFPEFPVEKDTSSISHRKEVKKRLDAHLEMKRIKEEFDELDGEFDWNEYNK